MCAHLLDGELRWVCLSRGTRLSRGRDSRKICISTTAHGRKKIRRRGSRVRKQTLGEWSGGGGTGKKSIGVYVYGRANLTHTYAHAFNVRILSHWTAITPFNLFTMTYICIEYYNLGVRNDECPKRRSSYSGIK